MRRRRLLPPLLLLLLAGSAPAQTTQTAQPLGKLARKHNNVKGTLPSGSPSPMSEGQAAVTDLRVETAAASAALFALGKATASLTMGPESRFTFRQGVFTPQGEVNRYDFWVEWGKFRYATVPKWGDRKPQTVLGNAPHQVSLKTPSGVTIDLYGTDVYLDVDRQSGAVALYVAEGAATVTARGRMVRVTAGHRTFVAPGEPPLPAVPVDPQTQTLSPHGGGHFPPEWTNDAPLINLQDPRLDLPK